MTEKPEKIKRKRKKTSIPIAPDDIVIGNENTMGTVVASDDLVTVRATRNFNQMRRGDTEVVDPKGKYWSDNIASGNLEVI